MMKALKGLKNERGSSLIAAMFIVMTMGIAGIELVEMTTGEAANGANQQQSANALYIGQAGLEHARNLVANGYNPSLNDQAFYGTDGQQLGDYTITPDFASNRVTVVSHAGLATNEQSIDVPFLATCSEIVTNNVQRLGNLILNLGVRNNCGRAAHIANMQIGWNWPAYPSETSAYVASIPYNTNKKIYKPSIGIIGATLLPGVGQAKNNVQIDTVDSDDSIVPSGDGVHEFEYFDTASGFTYGILFMDLPAGSGNVMPNGQYTVKVTYNDGSYDTATFSL